MSTNQERIDAIRKLMPYRRMGPTGLFISAISIGTWVNFGVEVKGDDARTLIETALKAGVNFIDTAEVYQEGESEKTLGRVLKELNVPRSDVVIATKIFWGGNDRNNKKPNDNGLSRKHIIEGTKASLERLQLDYVDVLLCHRPDVNTPIEETVRAMNWVIEKGWAFYWGTSEWSAEEIHIAQATAERLGLIGPVVEQPQYSLIARNKVESEFKRLFDEGKLGSTVWSPIGGGILTGKYSGTNKDNVPENSRLGLDRMKWLATLFFEGQSGVNLPWEEMLQRIDSLIPIAEKIGCSRAQLAVAWVLKNKHVSTALIGARNVDQLLENLESVKYVDALTPEIMEEIEAIVANKPKLREDFTRRNERNSFY